MSVVQDDEARRHFWLSAVRALVVYAGLTVVTTWPLVTVLGSRVPHDLGDPLLSVWNLWWNATHVPFSTSWWDAPQFFPLRGSIAFSDHRVGISVLFQPLTWAGLSPLFTYNVALLASFPLSALAAHMLVLALTRRNDAAFISGLSFGFNPYRIAHIEHLELLASYWMPVALLALHNYVQRPAARFVALFCVAWLLQSLCSSYYLFYFSVFVSLWLFWFLPARGGWKRSGMLVLAWIAAGILLLPVLLRYRDIHAAYGFERTLTEVEFFSADITALLSASPLLAVWRSSPRFEHVEGQLFPGAFAIALVVAGLVARSFDQRMPRWRWGRGILALGLVFGVIASTAHWLAPWKLTLGGVTASVSSPRKPLSIALACLALYALLHPRVRSAYQRKSLFAFYVIAAVVTWILSWGPAPKLLDYPVLYQPPYAWLMRLPGFSSGLRVPARFAMPAILALSVAAGLAFARVAPRQTRRVAHAVFLLLIAGGIVADSWVRTLPLLPPPSSWSLPLPPDQFDAVLELPLVLGHEVDAAAVYRSIQHLHPTLNGFSGYYPPHYIAMQLGLASGDQRVLSALAMLGRILIAIDRQNDRNGDWVRYVGSHQGIVAVGSSGAWSFFLLPSSTEERPSNSERQLAVERITSNFTSANAAFLTDDDRGTGWSTPGPQQGTEQVMIDLGAPKTLSGLLISLGAYPAEFPRHLVIDTSLDGDQWTTAWSGPTVALSVAASLTDPLNPDLQFHLNAPAARFLRLRQTQADDRYRWSIARLAVFGAARIALVTRPR